MAEENSTRSRLRTWGKIARRPESWPLEFLFLFTITILGKLLFGEPVVETVTWAVGVIGAVMTNPFVLLLMVPFSVLLFSRGVRKIREADEAVRIRETEARKEALESLRGDLGDVFAFAAGLARAHVLAAGQEDARMLYYMSQPLRSNYENTVRCMAQAKDGKTAVGVQASLDEQKRLRDYMKKIWIYLGLGDFNAGFDGLPEVVLGLPEDGEMRHLQQYDPKINRAVMSAHERNLESLDVAYHQIIAAIRAGEAEQKALSEAAKALGNKYR